MSKAFGQSGLPGWSWYDPSVPTPPQDKVTGNSPAKWLRARQHRRASARWYAEVRRLAATCRPYDGPLKVYCHADCDHPPLKLETDDAGGLWVTRRPIPAGQGQ